MTAHPSWCVFADDDTAKCGTHLSEAVGVPALGGGWRYVDEGAVVARVDVLVQRDERGRIGVQLAIHDPAADGNGWLAAVLTPDDAAAVAESLADAARGARQPIDWKSQEGEGEREDD